MPSRDVATVNAAAESQPLNIAATELPTSTRRAKEISKQNGEVGVAAGGSEKKNERYLTGGSWSDIKRREEQVAKAEMLTAKERIHSGTAGSFVCFSHQRRGAKRRLDDNASSSSSSFSSLAALRSSSQYKGAENLKVVSNEDARRNDVFVMSKAVSKRIRQGPKQATGRMNAAALQGTPASHRPSATSTMSTNAKESTRPLSSAVVEVGNKGCSDGPPASLGELRAARLRALMGAGSKKV